MKSLITVGRRLPKTTLAVHQIAEKLLEVFSNHIGQNNAITKDELFRGLYKHDLIRDDLGDWMRWEFTRRAMHLLRVRSHCFIANTSIRDYSAYFVVKDQSDAQYYIDRLDNNIARMRAMQKRCLRAVSEKWYNKTWQIESKPREVLELKK